jgi:hypothetical protein
VEHVFYSANWAQKLKLDQSSFSENFDTQALKIASVMVFSPGSVFGQYFHLLHFLCESRSADLIRIHPKRNQHFKIQGGQFDYPLLTALFAGLSAAARALVNLPPLPEDESPTKEAQANPRRNLG